MHIVIIILDVAYYFKLKKTKYTKYKQFKKIAYIQP